MSALTPLHEIHERLGASFTNFAGWSMPVRYSSDIAEHMAVRTTAGLFDLCHMGEVEVTGPHAGAALDYALVSHPSRIPVGRARYSMICDAAGGILDDLVVYRLEDQRYMVVTNASNARLVADCLDARAKGFEVDVRDASHQWALLAVQGPTSAAIVSAVTSSDIALLRYYAIEARVLADQAVLLARTGYTGEDGFEIYCDPSAAAFVWDALIRAGKKHGLEPAGLACRDSLRLEAGMPLYGHELTRSITPFEAGLGKVVSLDKDGDFVGRAALEKRGRTGPSTMLVGLVSPGRRAPRSGQAVVNTATGARVGEVTSGMPSPTLGVPIAMAFVPVHLSQPGTRLQVHVRGVREDVNVVPLPFYRRTA